VTAERKALHVHIHRRICCSAVALLFHAVAAFPDFVKVVERVEAAQETVEMSVGLLESRRKQSARDVALLVSDFELELREFGVGDSTRYRFVVLSSVSPDARHDQRRVSL
jgi:hypothetical protein